MPNFIHPHPPLLKIPLYCQRHRIDQLQNRKTQKSRKLERNRKILFLAYFSPGFGIFGLFHSVAGQRDISPYRVGVYKRGIIRNSCRAGGGGGVYNWEA